MRYEQRLNCRWTRVKEREAYDFQWADIKKNRGCMMLRPQRLMAVFTKKDDNPVRFDHSFIYGPSVLNNGLGSVISSAYYRLEDMPEWANNIASGWLWALQEQ